MISQIWIEAYKVKNLESKPISSSGVSVSFYYHMYGSQIGQLEIESYDGSSWTSRWSKSGQQHSSGAVAWTQATIDLSSYTVTKLRFNEPLKYYVRVGLKDQRTKELLFCFTFS